MVGGKVVVEAAGVTTRVFAALLGVSGSIGNRGFLDGGAAPDPKLLLPMVAPHDVTQQS